jgi:transposase-like protein
MASEMRCPRCHGLHCIRLGITRGHQRWRCQECRRTWSDTLGTPLFHVHTPRPEIVRAIRIVLRRGSLRAAEEITGHHYETIATWIKRLGEHAQAVTDILVHDLELSEVEVDEFWSFIGQKGGPSSRRGQPIRPGRGGKTRSRASTGAV